MKCPVCNFENVTEWVEYAFLGMQEYNLARGLCTRCGWHREDRVPDEE